MSARESSGKSIERIEPSDERAQRSLESAKNWLRRAKDNNFLGYGDLAVISSYLAMLHAANAFLFKEGVMSRDPPSTVSYFREHYPKFGGQASALELYGRLARSLQQDLDVLVEKADVKWAMEAAGELVRLAEETLGKKG